MRLLRFNVVVAIHTIHTILMHLDAKTTSVLSQKTEAERLRIAWGMWRSARRMLTNMLRAENGSWTDKQVETEVNRRMSRGA